MNRSDEAIFDPRIADWLEDDPHSAPSPALEVVLAAFPSMKQRRATRVPWTFRNLTPSRFAAVAATVLIVTVVGVYVVGPHLGNVIGGPPPSASPSPTIGQTPSPTPVSTPIVWTPDAADYDWPGPIRVEPVGGGFLVDSALRDDSVGELGPDAPAWIDITEVGYQLPVHDSGGLAIYFRGDVFPVPHPEDAWIAYGIVVDKDNDYVPDLRMGMDNAASGHRNWVADLATGDTHVGRYVGNSWEGASPIDGYRFGDSFYVGDDWNAGMPMVFVFTNVDLRFYAWASLIQDGKVVATDFAPDTGWFQRPPSK